MATLGQILKEAREKKGVTASQAAAATRMKIQTVEALERDDFSRIAAPTYAMFSRARVRFTSVHQFMGSVAPHGSM